MIQEKIIFEDEEFLVYQSNKGYDFHFWAIDKKNTQGWNNNNTPGIHWQGWLYGEEQEFLDWCDDNYINLENVIFKCANDDTTLDHEYDKAHGTNSWGCPKCGCCTSCPLEDLCYIEDFEGEE